MHSVCFCGLLPVCDVYINWKMPAFCEIRNCRGIFGLAQRYPSETRGGGCPGVFIIRVLWKMHVIWFRRDLGARSY